MTTTEKLPTEVNYLGVVWRKHPKKDEYVGFLGGDRFLMRTWMFGPHIHQARIDVLYPKTRSEFNIEAFNKRIRVGFDGRDHRTRRQAIRKMVEWVKRYQKKGPPTPREIWTRAFAWYGDVYKTRFGFLRTLVEGGGNGFDWLDGTWATHDADQWVEARRLRTYQKQQQKRFDEADRVIRQLDDLLGRGSKLEPRADRLDWGRTVPRLDSDKAPFITGDREIHPTGLREVPDDAHPTWAALSYETAQLLIRRPRKNPELAAKDAVVAQEVITDLETRFPWLKEPVVEGGCPMTHKKHSFGPASWDYRCIYCAAPRPEVSSTGP
jgi:hypothetical protein